MNQYRTHNCGEISRKDIDKDVILSGWLNKKRDHGGLLFLDLRDSFGVSQCVIDSEHHNFLEAESVRLESVITICGLVVKRSDDTINKNIPTGEIEIKVTKI